LSPVQGICPLSILMYVIYNISYKLIKPVRPKTSVDSRICNNLCDYIKSDFN
jgi:hypothetical protein